MQDTMADTTSYGTGERGITSAVFDDERQAHEAVNDLRNLNIADTAITVISRRQDDPSSDLDDQHEHDEDAASIGEGAFTGAGVGAATGAIFGLAAAAIPGVGPFITAGALAGILGVTAGAAASGAIVGGSAGAVAGAMSRWGISEQESAYYAGEVDRGSVYLGVDLSQTTASRDAVDNVLRRHGGRTFT